MSECEFPITNATSKEITNLLEKSKTIAIVGLSKDKLKDSYMVAKYLMEEGYSVFPVNPKYNEILGIKCYPDLKSIPEKVHIVNIFRKPEALPAIVDEAIEIKADIIWMQLGLAHNKSADKARSHGLFVVMSKCIKVEHKKISG